MVDRGKRAIDFFEGEDSGKPIIEYFESNCVCDCRGSNDVRRRLSPDTPFYNLAESRKAGLVNDN